MRTFLKMNAPLLPGRLQQTRKTCLDGSSGDVVVFLVSHPPPLQPRLVLNFATKPRFSELGRERLGRGQEQNQVIYVLDFPVDLGIRLRFASCQLVLMQKRRSFQRFSRKALSPLPFDWCFCLHFFLRVTARSAVSFSIPAPTVQPAAEV